MTRVLRICIPVFWLFSGLTLLPSDARAQCAGNGCTTCGFFKFTGEGLTQRYNTSCEAGTDCSFCDAPGLAGGSEISGDGRDLLYAIATADHNSLQALVDRHEARLLLDVERQILVVQGGGCDPTGLTSVLFLDGDRAGVLAERGVRSLPAFFGARIADRLVQVE